MELLCRGTRRSSVAAPWGKIGKAFVALRFADELADGARLAESGVLSRLATQNITDSGNTVLGRFPGYLDKADSRGASYFDIGDQWDVLVSQGIDPWDLNVEFSEIIAARGDRVLLSVPKADIPATGYLRDEVNFVVNELDYVWVNRWSLRPRGQNEDREYPAYSTDILKRWITGERDDGAALLTDDVAAWVRDHLAQIEDALGERRTETIADWDSLKRQRAKELFG